MLLKRSLHCRALCYEPLISFDTTVSFTMPPSTLRNAGHSIFAPSPPGALEGIKLPGSV